MNNQKADIFSMSNSADESEDRRISKFAISSKIGVNLFCWEFKG
jgi:hypothetical protein